ncbi:hypothetical protein ISF_06873 [Cordyceps fumosorosea ARSEF 2679]|uniref:Uncharacterized protein n=1 Tax=Cordyceps fumosorosea (strain ARSEF 2679) TaxID=1081104 RepID=A0A167R750_CORFA|nr:hypothetical protein ISF_06873 [Cordyceps fumosorosea ARSEF 2679]OAA58334.1 hypothetical protein ISF_06873 [Cordyceps fumosorosea ARSEF 2679]
MSHFNKNVLSPVARYSYRRTGRRIERINEREIRSDRYPQNTQEEISSFRAQIASSGSDIGGGPYPVPGSVAFTGPGQPITGPWNNGMYLQRPQQQQQQGAYHPRANNGRPRDHYYYAHARYMPQEGGDSAPPSSSSSSTSDEEDQDQPDQSNSSWTQEPWFQAHELWAQQLALDIDEWQAKEDAILALHWAEEAAAAEAARARARQSPAPGSWAAGAAFWNATYNRFTPSSAEDFNFARPRFYEYDSDDTMSNEHDSDYTMWDDYELYADWSDDYEVDANGSDESDPKANLEEEEDLYSPK